MMRRLRRCVAAGSLAAALLTSLAAQSPAAGVAGTWNISLQGHQVALVLEQTGKAVTGTLMIMGKDVPMEGEFVDGKLTLASDAQVGDHSGGKTVPLRLSATLKPDDTLEGEISSARGPMKWTAERLKPE